MDIQAKANNGALPPTSAYDLGDSILYPEFGELHSKITQQHIHIEKKVCEVFQCLAENPRNVVTRQHIFDHVWPNMTVTDDSLNRCISVLRRILRDFGHGLSIKTHPKIGFNLEAPYPSGEQSITEQLVSYASAAANKQPLSSIQKQHFPIYLILAALLFIVTVIFLSVYLITAVVNLKPTLVNQLENHRVLIRPFEVKSNAIAKTSYQDLNQALINSFANHPYHTSVDINAIQLDTNTSAEKLGSQFSARFVIQGSITESEQRHLLNWRLIDAKNGDILLSKSLNLKLSNTEVNSSLIITDAISTIGRVTFSGNTQQHVNYIVESANYLFNHRGSWQSHQPLLTLVAKAIVDIDPNSPEALKAMANFLVKTMWPLKYPNAPYASLATSVLEKAIHISPKDIELYQLLAQAYIQQYQWDKAASTVSLALIEFPANSVEISQLSAMIELSALQLSEKLLNYLTRAHQQAPLSVGHTSALIKAHLIAGNAIAASQLANSLLVEEADVGAFALPVGHLLWQHKPSTHSYQLILAGLNRLNAHKLSTPINLPVPSQLNLATALSHNELILRIPVVNRLYLYAASGDIDGFYSLALTLADSKQFNTQVFFSPNAQLLIKDERFDQLMNKIGLLPYWQASTYPNFCIQKQASSC